MGGALSKPVDAFDCLEALKALRGISSTPGAPIAERLARI